MPLVQIFLGQLLRLSLFQISVGMASVMLLGTLNRVMIVELSVPALIVASMIALLVLIAPLGFLRFQIRQLSICNWMEAGAHLVWFIMANGWIGYNAIFSAVLSGDQTLGPSWAGEVLAALAFIMTVVTTQTAGLALASDRASDKNRPRVVALLHVMFLVGMGISL